MVNLVRSQAVADAQIRRWGRGSVSNLIRASTPRSCVAARAEYSPRERGLYLDGSERFFISAKGLAVPPDHEQDMFEFTGVGQPLRRYKIILPPTGPRPNGIVMFYDCNCMFVA